MSNEKTILMKIVGRVWINKMDEYIIESICEDCGCDRAAVLYHICDEMDEPDHTECSNECNPRELPFVFRHHNKEKLDTFLRCVNCDSKNTEKQTEW